MNGFLVSFVLKHGFRRLKVLLRLELGSLRQICILGAIGRAPVDLAVAAASIATHVDSAAVLRQVLERVRLAAGEGHHLLEVAVALRLA